MVGLKKILCIKDYKFPVDDAKLFRKGFKYKIKEIVELSSGIKGVKIECANNLTTCFWEGSEYFDVDGYFVQ